MPARSPFANAALFPAAACYAALALPWSVLGMTGLAPAPPGLMTAGGHAHEMLFGYALAVVAGYLLGPLPPLRLASLVALWLAARVSFLLAPGLALTIALNGLFALLVALGIVPRFIKAAKKWRNKTVAPVVAALALCAGIAAWLASAAPESSRLVLQETVLLLTVLLFFMGGRIIAPALAGYLMRQGHSVSARVQPRVEGAVLILLGLTLLLNPWQSDITAAALLSAGTLVLVRWLRWRPWLCLRRPDLLALLIGYLWLGIGLLLSGAANLTDAIPAIAATHSITVGALGTLSLVVMMRTRLLYRFRDANHLPMAHFAAALIQAATLGRILPPMFGGADAWLVVSAALWAIAFILALVVLLCTLGKRSGPGRWIKIPGKPGL